MSELDSKLDRYRDIASQLSQARHDGDDETSDELDVQKSDLWDELTLEEKAKIDSGDWPEYVTCVSADQNGGWRSVCGRSDYPGFKFVNWEHADQNKVNEGRLLTCEFCEAKRAADSA